MCNNIPVNIIDPDNIAEIEAEYGDLVESFTLKCDRASDGLLTCDPIVYNGRTSQGPFATCFTDYGASLHYLENSAQRPDCSPIDGLYLISSEAPSTPTATSSLVEPSTPVATTSSARPDYTGRIYAKGGNVDGQYWNLIRYTYEPEFSSSLAHGVYCQFLEDRSLYCNGYPVIIYGTSLLARFYTAFAMPGSKLKCDRASDGLLTCDPIQDTLTVARRPFAACVSESVFSGPGITLHYVEDTVLPAGCTLIDGLYMT
jgi:hypothetical protein